MTQPPEEDFVDRLEQTIGYGESHDESGDHYFAGFSDIQDPESGSSSTALGVHVDVSETGIHADAAGGSFNIQGDDGGVSEGGGAAARVYAGTDVDGDGIEEFGIGGDYGPGSADIRIESETLTEAHAAAGEAYDYAAETAGQAYGDASEWVDETYDQVATEAEATYEYVSEEASATYDYVSESASEAYDSAAETASDAYDYASETASETYESAAETASDAYDYASETASGAYDSAAESVDEAAESVGEAAEEAWDYVFGE